MIVINKHWVFIGVGQISHVMLSSLNQKGKQQMWFYIQHSVVPGQVPMWVADDGSSLREGCGRQSAVITTRPLPVYLSCKYEWTNMHIIGANTHKFIKRLLQIFMQSKKYVYGKNTNLYRSVTRNLNQHKQKCLDTNSVESMTSECTLIHCANKQMHGDIELKWNVPMTNMLPGSRRQRRKWGEGNAEIVSHRPMTKQSNLILRSLNLYFSYLGAGKLFHIFIFYSFKYLARKLVGGNGRIVSDQRPNNQPLFFSSSVLSTGSQKLHRQTAFACFLN